MKLLYPNQSEASFIKTFTIKLNNRNYFFYTVDSNENASKVAFGELKEGSLFAVDASELDLFKRLLTDIANNRMISNPSYKKIETNLDTITIYGGSEATLSTKVLEPIFNAPVVEDAAVLETPVAEATVKIEKEVATDDSNDVIVAPILKEEEVKVMEKKKSNKLVFAIITALLLMAIGVGAYLLINNQKKPTPPAAELPKEEVKEIIFKKLVCTPSSPIQDTTNDEINETNNEFTSSYIISFNEETDELLMIEDIFTTKYDNVENYNKAKLAAVNFTHTDEDQIKAGIFIHYSTDDANLTVTISTVSKKEMASSLDLWNKVNESMLSYSQAKESLKNSFDCK